MALRRTRQGENCNPCIRFKVLPIYQLDKIAPPPLFFATSKISEIVSESVLLPVTIRGEVPGRAMRGGAEFELEL
jgi:hypothetical protein